MEVSLLDFAERHVFFGSLKAILDIESKPSSIYVIIRDKKK